jgi:hypothetical protein
MSLPLQLVFPAKTVQQKQSRAISNLNFGAKNSGRQSGKVCW